MEAARRGLKLPGLVKWITVGTPFIALRKEPLLFSRVSYFGKSTLVTLATFLILLLVAFYVDRMGGAFTPSTLVPVLLPFVAVTSTSSQTIWLFRSMLKMLNVMSDAPPA